MGLPTVRAAPAERAPPPDERASAASATSRMAAAIRTAKPTVRIGASFSHELFLHMSFAHAWPPSTVGILEDVFPMRCGAQRICQRNAGALDWLRRCSIRGARRGSRACRLQAFDFCSSVERVGQLSELAIAHG